MSATTSNKCFNNGGTSGVAAPGVRMSAASARSTDITNNSSGADWPCRYCGRNFDTKIGLGVHKSRLHREELNSERLAQPRVRVSNDDRQRNTISSRRRWTESEIKALAKLDLDLRLANPDMSEAAINRELASKMPGRSVDAIKGRKKDASFRMAQASIRETYELEPIHTIVDATVTGDSPENSMTLLTPVTNGGVEVQEGNGDEANSPVDLESNLSIVEPEALSSLPEATPGNQADEANGANIPEPANRSRIEETRLNYVDYLLLEKLKDDARLYAHHIRPEIRRSFKVNQLLYALNMGRGGSGVTPLLERWLDGVLDKGESIGNNGNTRTRRKRQRPSGNGDGRGLRGDKRLNEKVYLQNLYDKAGLKGVARHVLRNVDDNDSNTQADKVNPPLPEAMVEFWTDVFGTNIEGKYDVRSTSDEDSTANVLWTSVTQEDIKRTEIAKGKASGPDKITPTAWRSVPRSVRALFYNVILYHGVVIEQLSKARTVFIPKVKKPSNPGEYRPISITSVIQRQLHRVFVDRLSKVRKFDDRQVAFRNGIDGCSNNLATIRTLLESARQSRRDLYLLILDLFKAFDTAHHHIILETMSELKCPTLFIDYLKQLYSSAKTSLELSNGDSVDIRIGRGVFQGDPLSPLIFNHIIDRALKKLDEDYGYPCGTDNVTCMAFADDINLVGDSVSGTQMNINNLVCELRKFGLEVSPSKCLSLSIMMDTHRKIRVLDTNEHFTINGKSIKSITPSTKWKYLGVHFTGDKIDSQLPDIRPKLDRVKNSLLKPQQKLEIISKIILPALFHQAVLGNATEAELKRVDIQVRNTVREIMHFPHDIPICYIHAPVRCGGLGVPELMIRIPILRYKRMRRFLASDATVVPMFDRSVAYRHNKEKVEDFLRKNELDIEDPGVINKYYVKCLDHNFATRGLSEAYHSRQSRAWSGPWANEISGGDFIKYHLISSCSMPTLARRAWGRPGTDVQCRQGCGSTESLNHVLQECTLTHGGRVKRHNRVLDMVYNAIVRRFDGIFNVEKEPNLQTRQGLRKPDLLLHGGGIAAVIDLNIVGKEHMKEARCNKVAKYRDHPGLSKLIKQRYSVEKVTYFAITISYCGIIERSSRQLLRVLEFTGRDVFRMTTSVLRGSWLSWFRFKRTHQQHFFDSRY